MGCEAEDDGKDDHARVHGAIVVDVESTCCDRVTTVRARLTRATFTVAVNLSTKRTRRHDGTTTRRHDDTTASSCLY
jgi:hypothetical protein